MLSYSFFNVNLRYTQVLRLGMFEVHCDELVRGLAKRADALCSKLLVRMSKDHQEANKALCDEYETIAEKALTTPATTEQVSPGEREKGIGSTGENKTLTERFTSYTAVRDVGAVMRDSV